MFSAVFCCSLICFVVVDVSGVVGLIVCLSFDESWQNELLMCLLNGSMLCHFAHIHTNIEWARTRPFTLHAYFVRNLISVNCSRIAHILQLRCPKTVTTKKNWREKTTPLKRVKVCELIISKPNAHKHKYLHTDCVHMLKSKCLAESRKKNIAFMLSGYGWATVSSCSSENERLISFNVIDTKPKYLGVKW